MVALAAPAVEAVRNDFAAEMCWSCLVEMAEVREARRFARGAQMGCSASLSNHLGIKCFDLAVAPEVPRIESQQLSDVVSNHRRNKSGVMGSFAKDGFVDHKATPMLENPTLVLEQMKSQT